MEEWWRRADRIRRFICSPWREESEVGAGGADRASFRQRGPRMDVRCFVMTRGQIPAQVFRVDVGSGQRTLWRSFEPADSAGIDTIRGVLVSADDKSYVYGYSRTLSDLYLVQGLK